MTLKDLHQLFICLVRLGSLWCPSQLSVLHQGLRTDTGLCSCDTFTDSPRGIFSFPHPTSLQMEGVGNASSGLIPFVLDSGVHWQKSLTFCHGKVNLWKSMSLYHATSLTLLQSSALPSWVAPLFLYSAGDWVPRPCSTVLSLFAIPWGSVPGREEEDPEKSWSTEHSPGDTIFF